MEATLRRNASIYSSTSKTWQPSSSLSSHNTLHHPTLLVQCPHPEHWLLPAALHFPRSKPFKRPYRWCLVLSGTQRKLSRTTLNQGRSQDSEGHSPHCRAGLSTVRDPGCLNPCLCVVQSSELVFSVLFYETVEEKINLSKKTYIWVTGRGRLWRNMTINLEWIQQMCFCGSLLRLMFLGARALNVSTFTSLRPLSY